MVRGPRNREKLQGYYDLYMKTGQIDPNVNPEIAASWQKSRKVNPPTDRIRTDCRLSPETFAARQKLMDLSRSLSPEEAEKVYKAISLLFEK